MAHATESTCPVCFEKEPFTGTCGSNDPSALCKLATPAAIHPQPVEVLARGWLHRHGPGDNYDLHDEASGAGEDCAKCTPCVIVAAADYATLARQLAEAQAQLEVVTRRLAAVEGLLRESKDCALSHLGYLEIHDMTGGIEQTKALITSLDAALQPKE